MITRGLFRLWVVGSLLWVAIIGLIANNGYDPIVEEVDLDAAFDDILQKDPLAKYAAGNARLVFVSRSAYAKQYVTNHSGLIFGPPIGALAIGVGVIWVVTGFRREKGKPQ